MRLSFLTLTLVAGLAGAAHAQTTKLPPLDADVRPTRASGVGLVVTDLERSMKFYTEVLGFKVATRLPAEGPAREYILGMTGDRLVDTLVVLTPGKPLPGATSFGRVIMRVPSGRKMAERVAAAGFRPDKIVEGTNMVKDPDGYVIELYQPAPPVASNPPAH